MTTEVCPLQEIGTCLIEAGWQGYGLTGWLFRSLTAPEGKTKANMVALILQHSLGVRSTAPAVVRAANLIASYNGHGPWRRKDIRPVERAFAVRIREKVEITKHRLRNADEPV